MKLGRSDFIPVQEPRRSDVGLSAKPKKNEHSERSTGKQRSRQPRYPIREIDNTDKTVSNHGTTQLYCFIAIIALALPRTDTFSASSWFPSKNNTQINGYLKELPFLVLLSDNQEIEMNNLIHFRLNTRWYPLAFLTTEFAGRVQLYSGDSFMFLDPLGLQKLYGTDDGYVDLTRTWISLLYANIDRAWVAFTRENFTLTLGRQRVNWSTVFIWTPNDWFNTYNFLDFDYEERPGTDAVRLQYYIDVMSVVEIVLEAGLDQRDRTFAALYKFNRFHYDIQLQSGVVGNDWAAGLSWSGQIKTSGFRGEIAYFYPVFDRNKSTEDNIVAALSWDYVFPRSVYLHAEILYNGYGTTGKITSLYQARTDVSAKNLLPSRYALFGEISYQFTPLLRGSLAVSTNPSDFSFYLAPSFDWSVSQNIDFFTIAQIFIGSDRTLYGEANSLLALSLRWSF